MLGQEQKARQEMERALAVTTTDADVLFRAAILYNHYGDRSRTLDYLGKAVRAGYSKNVIREMPDFEHLRNEAQFQEILK
jgi:hypothetical protein